MPQQIYPNLKSNKCASGLFPHVTYDRTTYKHICSCDWFLHAHCLTISISEVFLFPSFLSYSKQHFPLHFSSLTDKSACCVPSGFSFVFPFYPQGYDGTANFCALLPPLPHTPFVSNRENLEPEIASVFCEPTHFLSLLHVTKWITVGGCLLTQKERVVTRQCNDDLCCVTVLVRWFGKGISSYK